MVLSVGEDGVFPPSPQCKTRTMRARTTKRHTGWPHCHHPEKPSGPENPTPPLEFEMNEISLATLMEMGGGSAF